MDDQPDFQPPWDQSRSSNPLGVVGFILSFCTGPIGLILSIVAVRREPRGLAIAGIVIGSLTTLLGACCGIAGVALWPVIGPAMHTAEAAERIDFAIDAYRAGHNGDLPASFSDLNLGVGSQRDGWDREMRYIPDPDKKSWRIISAGTDGKFDTGDDMEFSSGMTSRQRRDVVSRECERAFN